jgi:hypothetical protein
MNFIGSEFNQALMFEDLNELLNQTTPDFHKRQESKLPKVCQLNSQFQQSNQNNKKLKFVIQDHQLPFIELGYEERIFKHGFIAHREENWHDFFNALIWKKFPQTKTLLNAIHYKELQNQTSNLRSKKRDILTLFDECGVLVQASKSILSMIRKHQWNSLFIENKQLWLDGKIKVTTFGHAMYEKYLNPYIGMTAKALLMPRSVENLDAFLVQKISNEELLHSKSDLHPLPMLGIPDWYKEQTLSFYANKQYFR